MYKNQTGMSRLNANNTGLSLPPLVQEEPSPRMSIVKEGLSSKSRVDHLVSLRESGGVSQVSRSKVSSQPKVGVTADHNGFSLPADDDNLDLFQPSRYQDIAKSNSRINLDDATQGKS